MKIIELPCFGIRIELTDDFATITSELKDDDNPDGEDNTLYDATVDGIESMIMAHACEGIDVKSPRYVEGIKIAVQAAANHLL